jgi:hypothetical protein
MYGQTSRSALRLLARALGMDAPPIPRFSPVIGAGLHALSAIAL